MALSSYDTCPCGSGKKVKFCCRDLAGEIEKIERMIQAGQQHACLEHVERLLQKHPDRSYLQTRRIELLRQLGRADEAENLVDSLLEKAKDNPVALAEASATALSQGKVLPARDRLHEALRICSERGQVQAEVWESFDLFTETMLAARIYAMAQGHVSLMRFLAPESERAVELQQRIESDPETPLPMKALIMPRMPDRDDPAFFDVYAGCQALYGEMNWQRAKDVFREAAEKYPQLWQPRFNLALTLAWLGDDAASAWSALGAMTEAPADIRALAEALAMLSDDSIDSEPQMARTYAIAAVDPVLERLIGQDRLIPTPQSSISDRPPPRAAYLILDRKPPARAEELSFDNLARLIGRAWVFGRETDREPTLEVVFNRSDASAVHQLLGELLGDALRAPTEDDEQIGVHYYSPVSELTRCYWPPSLTGHEQQLQFIDDLRSHQLLEVWPQTRLDSLGGKTPLEAAADPQWQSRLQGRLLILDWELNRSSLAFDTLRIYQRLGIEPVQPSEFADGWQPDAPGEATETAEASPVAVHACDHDHDHDHDHAGCSHEHGHVHAHDDDGDESEAASPFLNKLVLTPACFLASLPIEKLPSTDLLQLLTFASRYRAVSACWRSADLLASRNDTSERERELACLMLVGLAGAPLEKARRIAAARATISPANASGQVELELAAIENGAMLQDEAAMTTAFQRLERYMDNPHVRQRLGQLLMQLGMITPEGQPVAAPAAAQPEAASQKIWTPDSPGPAQSAGPSSGSKLWIPD